MGFGSWSIERECFDKILELLPAGGTVLELGSGFTTGELAKHYSVISIEHDANHIGKHPSRYIHAPLKLGWYDPHVVAAGLAGEKYDLLLIDGPPAFTIGNQYSRLGMLAHLDLFDLSVPIVLDDVERRPERTLADVIAWKAERPFRVYNTEGKSFAVI